MSDRSRRKFWQVGGRTLKTVAAVFISLVTDGARPGGMPFYAAITAIFCIQKNVSDSFETAVNREISTIVGGLFGMLFLFAEQALEGGEYNIARDGAVALFLIPIISVSVWLGRPKSTFLMCVVFLSVVIMHGEDVHPFYFALNRIIDTTIGIVTALIVNLGPSRFRVGARSTGAEKDADTSGSAGEDGSAAGEERGSDGM